MPLIKRLCDLQGALRGETEAAVRFALQGSEIVELRCDLSARFFLFEFDHALPATALAPDCLGDFAMPQSRRSAMLLPKRSVFRVKPLLSVGQIQLEPSKQSFCSLDFIFVFLECFIEPASHVFASCGSECADDLVQLARLKFLNLVLPIYDDCQRRCLNAAK